MGNDASDMRILSPYQSKVALFISREVAESNEKDAAWIKEPQLKVIWKPNTVNDQSLLAFFGELFLTRKSKMIEVIDVLLYLRYPTV
jgi:hypothetical protein